MQIGEFWRAWMPYAALLKHRPPRGAAAFPHDSWCLVVMVEMTIDDFDDTGSCWLQYDVQLKIKTTFGWQLTESLSSSKFSDRVVPVHPTVWVIFLGRTLSHRSSRELSKKAIVGQGRSSKHWLGTDGFLQLLVSSILLYQTLACTKILVFSLNAYVFFLRHGDLDSQSINTVPKTFGFLLFFCRKVDPPVYLYISGLIAPISLDFCASLGQSATMSGLLLASPVLGTTVGAVCGKFLASESNWNQDSHMGLRLKNREGKVVCQVCLGGLLAFVSFFAV